MQKLFSKAVRKYKDMFYWFFYLEVYDFLRARGFLDYCLIFMIKDYEN